MNAGAALHGAPTRRVAVDTARMEWASSPSASVWRKRVHRVGPTEAGQVTSIVRYDAHSRFRAHDHPDGEEILVLAGTFSDEHGDWRSGTYLINPEGFHHEPFSRDGCLLFVKLRQLPGPGREHLVPDTNGLPWQATTVPGVLTKLLYAQQGFSDRTRLERWAPHTDPGEHRYADGCELLVLAGSFEDGDGAYSKGAWMLLPIGFAHHPRTETGCTLYRKEGGPVYLQSAPEIVSPVHDGTRAA